MSALSADLSALTVLITGATDGLGRAVAMALARRGATILVHGRDPERIELATELLLEVGATAVRSYLADYASLADVHALGETIAAREPRIDALVNNVGVGTAVPTRERATSRDGIELRFAVNYLSHYVLTRALVPVLRASAPARVVNVASLGQAAIDFDDPMLTRDYSGVRAYCQSKLAQLMFTFDLAEELAGSGVTVNGLHPASYMPTKIVEMPISPLDDGVRTTVRMITAPELAGVTGRFFDGTQEARINPQGYDLDARARLRELSNALAERARA